MKGGAHEKDGGTAVAAGLACALLAFVLYLMTLAPTVLYYDPNGLYDSAMLQVQAYVLDIPNPTGYPTYVLLGHLFTYLPLGDVAYRVNLASAVYAALAVLVLFLVCLKLTGRVVPAAAGAILFGVSRTFWSQAVVAEVYTLNAFFLTLTLLTLLAWRAARPDARPDTRRDRYLLLASFLMGLSLTNHLTSGLLLPAGLVFVLLVEPRKLLEWRLVLKGIGLFLLGLLPYLYLPVRASMDPPINETDPSTPARFVNLVSGYGFEGRTFVFPPAALPGRLELYWRFLHEQFHPALLAVALLGVGWLLLKDRAALALFAFLYLGWLFHALEYDIKDIYLYFIPTYLVLAVFAAAGFRAVLAPVFALARRLPRVARPAALAAVSVLALALPLYEVRDTYAVVDRSGDYAGRRVVEAAAEHLKPGATVLHNGSSLWYMTLVEGRRGDVRLVDPFEPGAWIARNNRWAGLAKGYAREGSVYVLFPGDTAHLNAPSFEKAGLALVPVEDGLFYEVVDK